MSSLIKKFHYQQTDAISCTGAVGQINDILYACLVTGYNTQAISSLVITDNVAIVTTSSSHGYLVDDVVNISGANESVVNDDFIVVSVPDTTHFTFNVTSANLTATGTLSAKIAPLGWERVYSGTNKAVYRSLDVTSTRIYLRVDDTAAKTSTLNMYETMSDVDTGTNKGTDVFWCRLLTVTDVRKWYLVGNKSCFYLMIASWITTYPGPSIYFFGDIIKFRENDPWACALVGHSATNPSYSYQNTSAHTADYTTIGMVLTKSSSWIGGNAAFGFGHLVREIFGYGSTYGLYPAKSNNKCNISPVYVWEPVLKTYRGLMPGMYAPLEATNSYIVNNTKYIYNNKSFVSFSSGQGISGGSSSGNWFLSLEPEDW